MMLGIDNPQNKEKIAVVVVGYNRINGIVRLLDSLNHAEYDEDKVPLVISIDASGNQSLYDYANSFNWLHGIKYVNIQKERLGLKNHIFQCFALSKFFKGVIVLEDDIFVSPYYYHYAESVLERYCNEEKVAGIAFYTNEYDGFCGVPSQYIRNGYDVFACQSVCSWGEMINERMWNNFSAWIEEFDDNFDDYDMPNRIKQWKRAWSKYMYAYMLQSDSYFIYPYEPLTTNFNDAGGEHGGGDNCVQVSLQQGKRNYQFAEMELLEHYDVYGNNMKVADWLGLKREDLSIDYSKVRDYYYGRYVLSTFKLPYIIKRGFRLSMRPWELNVKYGIDGDDFYLYDREKTGKCSVPKRQYTYSFLKYHLSRYMPIIRPRFVFNLLRELINMKFRHACPIWNKKG